MQTRIVSGRIFCGRSPRVNINFRRSIARIGITSFCSNFLDVQSNIQPSLTAVPNLNLFHWAQVWEWKAYRHYKCRTVHWEQLHILKLKGEPSHGVANQRSSLRNSVQTLRYPHQELKSSSSAWRNSLRTSEQKGANLDDFWGKKFVEKQKGAKQTLRRKRTLTPCGRHSELRLSTEKHLTESRDGVEFRERSVHLAHPRRQSGDLSRGRKPVAPRSKLRATPKRKVENSGPTDSIFSKIH